MSHTLLASADSPAGLWTTPERPGATVHHPRHAGRRRAGFQHVTGDPQRLRER
ncbi:hypothetical protein [Streptomyces regalis]|uniref:hypothetical protein n=1 Tax=Streptomyces regalis TaxID=68262 RepID=UPI00131CFC09|nr:hypothetical protein [Streptomyces regalis]